MDVWEANARATGLTPHACNVTGLNKCTGEDCGSNGVCDESGCGYNPYWTGAHDFYGYEKNVDTKKSFTVVTQFVTSDNTTGALTEICRQYVQNGKSIRNATTTVSGKSVGAITEKYCSTSASFLEDIGGLKQMGEALGRGMVLGMSTWNDADQFMTGWIVEVLGLVTALKAIQS